MLIGYSIILSFMVSKSFSIWKYRKVNRTFVYMTISATILFMLSDIILLIACFSISGADNRLKALNNFVYSISVALLGFSFKWELLPETLDSHHQHECQTFKAVMTQRCYRRAYKSRSTTDLQLQTCCPAAVPSSIYWILLDSTLFL